jgi:TatD DNase family protein
MSFDLPPSGFSFIDTHAHLDFSEYDADRDEVIQRARNAGIATIINIGASLERSERCVALAGRYPNLFATVGIHPHDADMFRAEHAQHILDLAASDKVVGIGEIGLDYYKNYSGHDNQRKLFAALLSVAREKKLPVVLHARDAEEDILEALNDFLPMQAVVHCFSGSELFLRACLDRGFYISFTCNVTYKKAQGIRDALRFAPLDRIMLETDAPYLPPEGMRGKRNEPSSVALLAQEVARIKGLEVAAIADATTNNARTFFKLP